MFDTATAKRIVRGFNATYHDVWQDSQGQKMLACSSRRREHLGVAVNLAALDRFRYEGGQFVGLMNMYFKEIVPIADLDRIKRWEGDDFMVVRPGDVGIEVAVQDDMPCPF